MAEIDKIFWVAKTNGEKIHKINPESRIKNTISRVVFFVEDLLNKWIIKNESFKTNLLNGIFVILMERIKKEVEKMINPKLPEIISKKDNEKIKDILHLNWITDEDMKIIEKSINRQKLLKSEIEILISYVESINNIEVKILLSEILMSNDLSIGNLVDILQILQNCKWWDAQVLSQKVSDKSKLNTLSQFLLQIQDWSKKSVDELIPKLGNFIWDWRIIDALESDRVNKLTDVEKESLNKSISWVRWVISIILWDNYLKHDEKLTLLKSILLLHSYDKLHLIRLFSLAYWITFSIEENASKDIYWRDTKNRKESWTLAMIRNFVRNIPSEPKEKIKWDISMRRKYYILSIIEDFHFRSTLFSLFMHNHKLSKIIDEIVGQINTNWNWWKDFEKIDKEKIINNIWEWLWIQKPTNKSVETWEDYEWVWLLSFFPPNKRAKRWIREKLLLLTKTPLKSWKIPKDEHIFDIISKTKTFDWRRLIFELYFNDYKWWNKFEYNLMLDMLLKFRIITRINQLRDEKLRNIYNKESEYYVKLVFILENSLIDFDTILSSDFYSLIWMEIEDLKERFAEIKKENWKVNIKTLLLIKNISNEDLNFLKQTFRTTLYELSDKKHILEFFSWKKQINWKEIDKKRFLQNFTIISSKFKDLKLDELNNEEILLKVTNFNTDILKILFWNLEEKNINIYFLWFWKYLSQRNIPQETETNSISTYLFEIWYNIDNFSDLVNLSSSFLFSSVNVFLSSVYVYYKNKDEINKSVSEPKKSLGRRAMIPKTEKRNLTLTELKELWNWIEFYRNHNIENFITLCFSTKYDDLIKSKKT